MTKNDLRKVLSAAKTRLVQLDGQVRDAEITLSSLQLRAGIVLAQVADALASRADSQSFKDWAGENYKGRSSGTLNRWKNSGAVAIVLGFTDEDENLPTVMDLEPLYRVLNTGKREEAEEKVRTAWAKASKASAKVTMPERTLAQATALVGEPKKGPKKNRPKAPADDAATTTVTMDTAELEARTSECKKALDGMNRQIIADSKKEGWTFGPASILKVRGQTLRLIEAHGPDIVGIVLGSKSGS